MKLFKILALLLPIYFISTTSKAQEVNREIGLQMSNLNDFSFIYKKQRSANKYLRIRAGNFNFTANISNDNSFGGIAAGFGIGFEKRKSIDDKLEFIHGFEPTLSVQRTNQSSPSSILDQRTIDNISPSLGYILGFQLAASKFLSISLETRPSLTVSMTSDNGFKSTDYRGSLGFSSNAVTLGFHYRFMK